jgi:hypothetical protein
MSGQRRRRLDAGAWREVLERFAAAGTAVDKFCERERLSTSSFYRWRDRLQSADARAVELRLPSATGVAVRPRAADFIELGSLAGSSRDADSGLELRLDLGGGVVLQITRR